MIQLYFDFVSPYSYLAWSRVGALAARVGREVEPIPVLFAAILGAHGTKGPAEVPARRAYVFKDILRAAHRAGVTIVPPRAHPFNPLLPLRVAGLSMEATLRARIIDALFDAAWAEGGSIDTPEALSGALGRAGIDAAPLVARATEPEAKEQLRRRTDEAIARGVFGVPTLFVDGEMFFGFDSFPDVEAFLRGEDPVASRRDLVERWMNVPAAATRR